MEQIVVRNLPPGTKAKLKARAKAHDRSVEAEARAIIAAGLDRAPVTLVDLLGTDDGADIEFEPARIQVSIRAVDL